MTGRLVVALAWTTCLAGCDRRRPISTCTQDLAGEYAVESTDRTWAIVDHGTTLQAYPLFPDAPAGDLEIAPRVIELSRTRGVVRGEVHRRYMQQATSCVARAPATVARCADDIVEIVLADPAPPLTFAPCRWGATEPSRRERWIRR